MRRRSKAGGKSPNAQAPKAAARKSRITAKVRARGSSTTGQEAKVARLTRELNELLQRQAASAEVLKVISRSTFDLTQVLNTLLASAARLCEADKGVILRPTGDASFYAAASYRHTPEYIEFVGAQTYRPESGGVVGRVLLEGRSVHVPDVLSDPDFKLREFARVGNFRTILGVPLLREGSPIGVVVLQRAAVRPFTERQIKLVESFADQAVIAIENTRLFEAEQQRTRELTELLEQQTAISEILRVISNSPSDVQPVLDLVAEHAARICEAQIVDIILAENDNLRTAATFGPLGRPPGVPLDRSSVSGRSICDRQSIHVADLQNAGDEFALARELAIKFGHRSALAVPLIREGRALGTILVRRTEVRPFEEKHIALLTTFADQAAIAIENVRLFDALRQRTDELGQSVGELRALGEVSQAVNSTLDLETVLSTIVAKAVQLSGTDAGAIYVFDDRQREFHLRATYGMDQELIEALAQRRMGLDDPNVAHALAQPEPIQVPDLREDARTAINEITLRAGYLARLVAPLRRGEDVVGFLVVRRRAPGAFPRSTVDLIKTFAAQSAVAIENARLFKNVETSLEDLRTAQDRLVQTQKLASLGQLTAGIAHEIKNPLNFVNNFSGVSAELMDELREALDRMTGDDETRAEIAELTNTLRDNLDKIVQHGKRADSIVKNMLLHSREGSGEHRLVDANALVEESLNLAYHGARAENQGFKINLERSFDPAAGQVDVFPQEITRALLNLISNGFYAATKRKEQDNCDGYEPTLVASTKNLGESVEIRIRDSGAGISPEVKEKMFNPFFTTKPAGEGTGLGLSITHDIIVKQHSGSIEVDTQPGEYTEIRIVLPRTVAIADSRERA